MRIKSLLVIAALAGFLAGCQDSGLDLAARSDKRIVVGPSVPVAIESLDGMPDGVAPRFSAALASAAQAREISFVDASGAPRFRLRGYLNAYSGEGGATIAWVWDVFDSTRRRAQRVSGAQALGKSAADPWSAVDDAALRLAAARSLDDVGQFLLGARSGADAPVAAAPARPAHGESGE